MTKSIPIKEILPKKEKRTPRKKGVAFVVVVIFLLLIIGVSIFDWWVGKVKLVPLNTTISGIEIGGMRFERAGKLVREKVLQVADQGVEVTWQGITKPLPVGIIVKDSIDQKIPEDQKYLASMIIGTGDSNTPLSSQASMDNVARHMREVPMGLRWINFIEGLWNPTKYDILVVPYGGPTIDLGLEKIFTNSLPTSRAQDAQLAVAPDLSLSIISEKSGQVLGISNLYVKISDLAENLQPIRLVVESVIENPLVTTKDIEPYLSWLKETVSRGDMVVANGDRIKTYKPEEYVQWIKFLKSSINEDLQVLGGEKFEEMLADMGANEQQEKDGKIVLDNQTSPTRATELVVPQDGVSLDELKTNDNFIVALQGVNQFPLVVNKIQSSLAGGEALGIKEVIGVGHSNFKNSPANRIHNITLGSDTINGSLVAPGEEFSLVKTLGVIDREHGYLPELVIKKNAVIPEDGGGLCQVGTTLFRAAVASGMPVTERHEHSYRVSYYEPAGTDCTIYNPRPDCKFKNDTTNYIMISTSIIGTDLTFTFWGTADGRVVEQTTPRIYNVVKALATKEVESDKLKPGERKCSGHPVPGADTEFSTTVTYAGGKKRTDVFQSHYVPWGELCLVGKKK